jgi:hypothetical protein
MFEIITFAGDDEPRVSPYVKIQIESEQLMTAVEVEDFVRRLRDELPRIAEQARQSLALALAEARLASK